ncbi:MAG: N-acetylmuramoyl-L-alanine amidase [Chroococcidiopsidaceae cyanobacterium CP_BM_RX_35]|nr:N-acetylmuramoyl-L-alanine amidase [Chroococcidiopsidaceae cyanobacterium CP_BM_RX_35]
MRFHWLIPGTLSVVLLASPAWAAKLQSWRLNSSHTQLDFKTEGGVQPQAQLIFNPTRLVIDLPRTTMDRPTVTQMVGGVIRSLHIGQFDDQTTRIVLELLPGYTLDPTKVRFRGASPSKWTVYLPLPQKVASNLPNSDQPPLLSERSPKATVPRQALAVVTPNSDFREDSPPPLKTAVTTPNLIQVTQLHITPDGFFLRTVGSGTPEIKVHRSSDRGLINIDLAGATLSPGLTTPLVPANYYGVQRLQVLQVPTSPPIARLTLQVNQNSPDWQATPSPLGGVVVVPKTSLAAADPPNRYRAPGIATIQSVQLGNDGGQLQVRADQPLAYSSGWDRSTGLYRIVISNAQLAEDVRGPDLGANSPLLRVRLLQPDSTTVVIWLQPATGVQVGSLIQPNVQMLALQLQRSGAVAEPPSDLPLPVPPVTTQTPPLQESPTPNGRLLVVIDPGHGGKDSGAVGIGGLEEKDIILPIGKQVAAILEQHGVQAIMTRDADYFVDLGPRVDLTRRVHANLFVSIHANSIDNAPQANGLEVYYFSDSSLPLAATIQRSILQSVDVKDRGVRHARFYVLRNNSIPAILIETGFVTGAEDAPRLASPAYQTQMAEAIARGILLYIKQHF